jgi:hypothetical protein
MLSCKLIPRFTGLGVGTLDGPLEGPPVGALVVWPRIWSMRLLFFCKLIISTLTRGLVVGTLDGPAGAIVVWSRI